MASPSTGPGEPREQIIPAPGASLSGLLGVPPGARGLVIFAHGSGSSRLSPRNARVGADLRAAGLATLLMDLLTEKEAADRDRVFDIELLASRLRAGADWASRCTAVDGLPIGYFGASTGAAAALVAAADDPRIGAVVSRGGRPDLAGAALDRTSAPTLLIVGGRDDVVLDLNRRAQVRLASPSQLEVVPGATHLFDEPGTLEQVSELAADWFVRHLDAGCCDGPAGDLPAPDPSEYARGFRDRADAGELLARALRAYRGTDAVVLGLPRGGVEVGAVVARRLGLPLDVLLVRKLPAPGQPELALGAVADGANPVCIVDERRARALGVSRARIDGITETQLTEIHRRARLYRGARSAISVTGRTGIVVDDGVATGSTAEAALRIVRAQNPGRLILAVPVGAPESLRTLAPLCDRIVCLTEGRVTATLPREEATPETLMHYCTLREHAIVLDDNEDDKPSSEPEKELP